MSRVFRNIRLSALTVLLLLLAISCSQVGDKVKDSEAIVQGTGITYQGTSMAATTVGISVTFTFDVIARNQGSQTVSPLSAIEFLTWSDSPSVPNGALAGNMEGIFFPVGSTGNQIILGLGAKSGPGVLYAGHVHFAGVDNLGKAVTWDVDYSTVTTQ